MYVRIKVSIGSTSAQEGHFLWKGRTQDNMNTIGYSGAIGGISGCCFFSFWHFQMDTSNKQMEYGNEVLL